jgi:Ca2+-binding EF-hand superfamily protein
LSTINLKQMINKDKLRAVFKMFDVENLGVITMEQVRAVLRRNGVKEAKNWPEMLK